MFPGLDFGGTFGGDQSSDMLAAGGGTNTLTAGSINFADDNTKWIVVGSVVVALFILLKGK